MPLVDVYEEALRVWVCEDPTELQRKLERVAFYGAE